MVANLQDIIDAESLGTLDYIAEGGQGRIFRCVDLPLPDFDGALAYKQYKPGQVSAAGLEAIITIRSRLSPEDRNRLDHLSTGPVRLVREAGQVNGILMPPIREEFLHIGQSLTGSQLRKERKIQYLFLATGRVEKLGFPRTNLFQRYAICRDFAGALAFLHERNVVCGDISSKNALFSVGPGRTDAGFLLVDCDAVRVRGTMSAVPQLNSPDWEPPAAERTQLNQETDVYKYALFVLRCLSPGPQASTARDMRRVDSILDQRGQYLLRASLSAAKELRPRAVDWQHYFADLFSRAVASGVAVPAMPTAGLPGTQSVAAPQSPQSAPQAAPPPAAAGAPARSTSADPRAARAGSDWRQGPNGEWVRS